MHNGAPIDDECDHSMPAEIKPAESSRCQVCTTWRCAKARRACRVHNDGCRESIHSQEKEATAELKQALSHWHTTGASDAERNALLLAHDLKKGLEMATHALTHSFMYDMLHRTLLLGLIQAPRP